MGRFCYCTKILPGKSSAVREHWEKRECTIDAEAKADKISFWNHLRMTGFESWLQSTPQGDFMIHCLEGESLKQIFKGLREQIASRNSVALKLQAFYLDVLGKDYANPEVEPLLKNTLEISLATPSHFIKRGFFYPLLPHSEEAHLAMGEKRGRQEAMMRAFGVSHLSQWLQSTPQGKYLVIYTERDIGTPSTPEDRLKRGEESLAWKEISAELREHTGLSYAALSPDVEWLTK